MKHLLVCASIALGATAGTSQAAVVLFDDQASFTAALGGLVLTLDDFSSDIAAAPSIKFSSGVTSTIVGGAPFVDDNSVRFGRFETGVDEDGTIGAFSTDFLFPSSVTALAFDYAGLRAQETVLTTGGQDFVIERNGAAGTNSNGFFGLISDDSFSFASFRSIATGQADEFTIDNLRFGAPAPVPLPASALLLLAAIGSFFGLRRAKART
ncbi:hypothetical protein JANAI62_25480 [Jannaschia pagri]|uniref:VPLPA-CTERM protein sorting domain-containing protein n=1 Tax=Jannaschia pagri TaxID=2829797 RepID=A0ABQ4NNS9_9RHOB|nr:MULTISPECIES: hypothetical protein [unclassified Jannaschia]GIT92090.1 hypothetical protein JANAI61_25480 [Jannaschia sp. AI_61]GIT95925.1 hypothetical protein JANAI62_25480 [Jannaschia sp. AI_62]